MKQKYIMGVITIALVSLFGTTAAKAERYCREYQKTVYVGGEAQPAYGQACYQPDGSWEIVSTHNAPDFVRYINNDVRYNHGSRTIIRQTNRAPVYYNRGYHKQYYHNGYAPRDNGYSFTFNIGDYHRDDHKHGKHYKKYKRNKHGIHESKHKRYKHKR